LFPAGYNDDMIEIKQTEVFETWLDDLRDRRAIRLIAARLERLTHGHFGDAKPVGGGISELRIHYGAGYRIYFQQRGKEIVLLLCGGDKNTQARDIQRARAIAKQWRDENE